MHSVPLIASLPVGPADAPQDHRGAGSKGKPPIFFSALELALMQVRTIAQAASPPAESDPPIQLEGIESSGDELVGLSALAVPIPKALILHPELDRSTEATPVTAARASEDAHVDSRFASAAATTQAEHGANALQRTAGGPKVWFAVGQASAPSGESDTATLSASPHANPDVEAAQSELDPVDPGITHRRPRVPLAGEQRGTLLQDSSQVSRAQREASQGPAPTSVEGRASATGVDFGGAFRTHAGEEALPAQGRDAASPHSGWLRPAPAPTIDGPPVRRLSDSGNANPVSTGNPRAAQSGLQSEISGGAFRTESIGDLLATALNQASRRVVAHQGEQLNSLIDRSGFSGLAPPRANSTMLGVPIGVGPEGHAISTAQGYSSNVQEAPEGVDAATWLAAGESHDRMNEPATAMANEGFQVEEHQVEHRRPTGNHEFGAHGMLDEWPRGQVQVTFEAQSPLNARAFDPLRPQATLREAIQQMIRDVEANVGDEVSNVRLRLVPERLGELDVRLAVERGTLSAHFIAQSEQVRALIESALPDLRQQLEEHGVSVSQLDVAVGERENQDSSAPRQEWTNSRPHARQAAFDAPGEGAKDLINESAGGVDLFV